VQHHFRPVLVEQLLHFLQVGDVALDQVGLADRRRHVQV